MKRAGNYSWNPNINEELAQHPKEIEGEEVSIPNPEWLSAPFAISHIEGSASSGSAFSFLEVN